MFAEIPVPFWSSLVMMAALFVIAGWALHSKPGEPEAPYSSDND